MNEFLASIVGTLITNGMIKSEDRDRALDTLSGIYHMYSLTKDGGLVSFYIDGILIYGVNFGPQNEGTSKEWFPKP
jgi:hypothetical protein